MVGAVADWTERSPLALKVQLYSEQELENYWTAMNITYWHEHDYNAYDTNVIYIKITGLIISILPGKQTLRAQSNRRTEDIRVD